MNLQTVKVAGEKLLRNAEEEEEDDDDGEYIDQTSNLGEHRKMRGGTEDGTGGRSGSCKKPRMQSTERDAVTLSDAKGNLPVLLDETLCGLGSAREPCPQPLSIDSGAAEAAIPSTWLEHHAVHESDGSKAGTVYTTANGEEVFHEGEKKLLVSSLGWGAKQGG